MRKVWAVSARSCIGDVADLRRPERQSFRGDCGPVERQAKPVPGIDQRFGKRVDQAIVVEWARSDAQTLASPRHRRIIDWLDVNAVLRKQEIRRLLAFVRV